MAEELGDWPGRLALLLLLKKNMKLKMMMMMMMMMITYNALRLIEPWLV